MTLARRTFTVESADARGTIVFDPTGVHRLNLPEGVRGIAAPNADNWAYSGCRFHVDTPDGPFEIRPGDEIEYPT